MNSKGKTCRGQVQHLSCFFLICDPSVGLGNCFKGLLVTIGITEVIVFLQVFCLRFGVIPLLLQSGSAQKFLFFFSLCRWSFGKHTLVRAAFFMFKCIVFISQCISSRCLLKQMYSSIQKLCYDRASQSHAP